MSVGTAVALGIGLLLMLAFIRGFTKKTWPSPRQIAGLWLAGLILLLIGRASPAFAKGLMLIMVLAVGLSLGGVPQLAVLTKSTATPSPTPTPAK